MTITSKVSSQFFDDNEQNLIRIAQEKQDPKLQTKRSAALWTSEEHNRFLQALERYPSGPWKIIASYVGTRTTRQTMTHAQKYREKIARHKRFCEESDRLREQLSAMHQDQRSTSAAAAADHGDEVLLAYSEVDNVYDATLAALLESYEPLDLSADDDLRRELEVSTLDTILFDDTIEDVNY